MYVAGGGGADRAARQPVLGAQGAQRVARGPLRLADQAEQQVLAADVVVPEAGGLGGGHLQGVGGGGAERGPARLAVALGAAAGQLLAHRRGGDLQHGQDPQRQVPLLGQDAVQQVARGDHAAVLGRGQLLRVLHRAPRALGEADQQGGVLGVEGGRGALADGGDAAHGLLQGALADGGDRDAGFLDRLGQFVRQVDVDLGHRAAALPLGL